MNNNKTEEGGMLLMIAGKDCRADLGESVAAEAAALDVPVLRNRLAGESVIFDLAKCESEADYQTLLLQILSTRTQLDLNECKLPGSSGDRLVKRVVGKIRGILWRLLRFGPEWMVFHQNVINEQQTAALEHEAELRRRENDELRKRIERLESRLAAGEVRS